MNAAPRFALDHVVVAASSLAVGGAWCRDVLGAEAVQGGRHGFMGTHNLLLGIGSARFARCYLEIIAVDPEAAAPTAHRRWFDLDEPALREAIAAGPVLVHWVARTNDIAREAAALRVAGHDVGRPRAAERTTPAGLLSWRITLRDDGVRPGRGAVPTLIEWDAAHPTDSLPESAVRLEAIGLGGIERGLASALGSTLEPSGDTPLVALFETPRGRIRLDSLRAPA